MISSSSALLFRCCLPHLLHWNKILYSEFKSLYSIGNIVHWQSDALSPGISPSTCKLQKHLGQWFLHVLAAWLIGQPQWIHTNDSFIFFILKFSKQKNQRAVVNQVFPPIRKVDGSLCSNCRDFSASRVESEEVILNRY